MRVAYLFLILGFLAAVPQGRLSAQESAPFDFDIFEKNDSLTVWVDFSPLITSKRVARMKDGIDIAVEYRLTLLRPRRIWGNEKVGSVYGAYQIGYRLITEDYFLTNLTSDSISDKQFLALSELHQHLADSMNIALAAVEPLDVSQRYFVRLGLTCVSLTRLNLADGDQPDESGKSAIRWLFKGFLDLTNFGREDYRAESRLFSLSEISSGK
ncbi:MAG: DUF4390 domain-containing protein [Candidatus Zixiibacteriota bacterium]|nr:MAG: DUF4390 domain-containing protein [candidate division Zixibacteria bacterium]